MVLEKIFVCYSHCKHLGANVPMGEAILNPNGIIGTIYVKRHMTLLCTKYTMYKVSEKNVFDMTVSYCKPMASIWELMTSRMGPFLTTGLD